MNNFQNMRAMVLNQTTTNLIATNLNANLALTALLSFDNTVGRAIRGVVFTAIVLECYQYGKPF